jgi:hypothetical protein
MILWLYPLANGEIGGYPVILDRRGDALKAHFDVSFFSMEEMREANRKSIYHLPPLDEGDEAEYGADPALFTRDGSPYPLYSSD